MGGRGQAVAPGAQGGSGQGASIGGGLSAEDARQFGREFRNRRQEAEELRRTLGRQGIDVRELAPLIARMRELENARVFDDPEEVERLQTAVVDGLKDFEFALRRRVEGATTRPRLGGADEVPAGFRQLVEEYYRSLARPGGR